MPNILYDGTTIEAMTHSATFNCPCGTTWFQSLASCYTRLPNGSELQWAEVLPNGSYLCKCGQGFNIWPVGRPVEPHPRQHPERA